MTFTISGTGASFVTDSAALINGRPADATRMQWLSAGSPATTDFVQITATFGNAISARCAALLLPNTSGTIPAGVKIEFSGKLSGSNVALGGNALAARTVLLPCGATAIFVVFSAVSIDTLIVKIYNDKNSVTWATTSELVDLGELWCGEGADFAVANDLDWDLEGGLLKRQAHNNQAWALEQQPYRVLKCNLVPMEQIAAIGPNPDQADYETVMNALSTQKTCVMIAAYLNPGNSPASGTPPPVISTTTINTQLLARTFILGSPDASLSLKHHPDGPFYASPITFGESPP